MLAYRQRNDGVLDHRRLRFSCRLIDQVVPAPTSCEPGPRIVENAQVFNFELEADDLARLYSLNEAVVYP